jgi:hypothetical protein
MTYVVGTDAALARILGVTRPAVVDAEQRGKIRRRRDGFWDVLQAVRDWRANTWGGLQRPRRASTFRPWLDPNLPFRASLLAELERRAVGEGAERVPDEPADQEGDDLVLDDDWDDGDGDDEGTADEDD